MRDKCKQCGLPETHKSLMVCVLRLKGLVAAARKSALVRGSRERYLYRCAEEALGWITQRTEGLALDVKDSLRVALRAYDKKGRKK